MIENTTFYHSLTNDDKKKIKEAEKEICEFLHDYVKVERSEMYRILVGGGSVPRWCFSKILQYLEDNEKIIIDPIYTIKEYTIHEKVASPTQKVLHYVRIEYLSWQSKKYGGENKPNRKKNNYELKLLE